MISKKIFMQTEEKMKKTAEKVHLDFATIRTGRASLTILDNVRVECYNTQMPLQQVATVTIPDAKSIEIKPWDKTLFPEIEKSILKANLGITPINDGKVIRLSIPPLTQERRQDLIKVIRKMTEDFRVSLRNERRDSLELLRKSQKSKEITEDEYFEMEKELQKLIDIYNQKLNEVLAAKEKEIMEI